MEPHSAAATNHAILSQKSIATKRFNPSCIMTPTDTDLIVKYENFDAGVLWLVLDQKEKLPITRVELVIFASRKRSIYSIECSTSAMR